MTLNDVSSGSRYEITGISTLDEAVAAIMALFSKGLPVGSPFHCYLNGTSFSVWTEEVPNCNEREQDSVSG